MAFKHLNRHSIKLKTPELIQEAFLSYCDHLAKGFPKEAWFFYKDGKPMCGWLTIEKYIEKMDSDLSSAHISSAEAQRYKVWFDRISESATGKNKDCNAASLQIVMRNMFGWDKKEEEDADDKSKEEALQTLKGLASAMTKLSSQSPSTDKEHKEDQS